jgi:TetR/AcrR family transcriptional repressor of nem operon
MSTLQEPKAKASARNDTRTRLLTIGTEVLSQKGFASTGVEEILSVAGVPKGSFYYYFESKAAFGLAVIETTNTSGPKN